jgi:hypothetical protein
MQLAAIKGGYTAGFRLAGLDSSAEELVLHGIVGKRERGVEVLACNFLQSVCHVAIPQVCVSTPLRRSTEAKGDTNLHWIAIRQIALPRSGHTFAMSLEQFRRR